jgi:hypothetical protein
MSDGDLIIDATGVGSESALRQAQPFGSEVLLRLKKPSTFTVEVGGVAVLTVSNEGGAVRIELGADATERVVLGDSFRAFLNQFIQEKFDAHVHALPNGTASSPPQAAFTGAQMPEELLSPNVRAR